MWICPFYHLIREYIISNQKMSIFPHSFVFWDFSQNLLKKIPNVKEKVANPKIPVKLDPDQLDQLEAED